MSKRTEAEIEEIIAMCDGDLRGALKALMLVNEHLDMVVGLRVDQDHAAYRRGHRTGNRMLTRFLSSVFGQAFTDILSGYMLGIAWDGFAYTMVELTAVRNRQHKRVQNRQIQT